MHVLLQGIVGSTAYGLAGPDSDVDRIGIFAAPTVAFHGLTLPITKELATVVQHEPSDSTYHEALKACHLMMGGNPTLSEVLWLESHEIRTALGDDLVDIRMAFTSAERCRAAYFGYAVSQLKRLLETGQFQSKMRKRQTKHGRHLLRLLDQGYALYTTGHLPIRVEDPQRYFDFGDRVATDPDVARAALAEAEAKFDVATSPLPDEPDKAAVEAWLLRVRRAFLDPS